MMSALHFFIMKITKLETIHLPDYPNILFVGVHTDAGISGWSDTFYMPDAMRGFIHQFAAPMLIGHDPATWAFGQRLGALSPP